jgi:hypothetical protein
VTETPTDTQVVTLTGDDLAAMKVCEDVSLHLHDGRSYLRVYTRAYGDPPIFTAKQQRLFTVDMYSGTRGREIATTADAVGYGAADGTGGWRWESGNPDSPACFYSAYQRDVWATIVRSLKVGDRLHVAWTADNNNGHSRAAGLHVDQVKLVAFPERQPERGPQVRSTWHVGWSICEDNTARMIRRHP